MGRIIMMNIPDEKNFATLVNKCYDTLIDKNQLEHYSDKEKSKILEDVFNGRLFVYRDEFGITMVTGLNIIAEIKNFNFLNNYIREHSLECIKNHFYITEETVECLRDYFRSIIFANNETEKISLINKYFPDAIEELEDFVLHDMLNKTIWHSFYETFSNIIHRINYVKSIKDAPKTVVYII